MIGYDAQFIFGKCLLKGQSGGHAQRDFVRE
jgi:hypothetical protein